MHCPSCLTDSSAKRVVVAPASRWWTTFLVAVLAFITLNGCSRPVEIRQYKIPKPPHRMLGAIVTREGEAWFFKLTGPRADVARHVDGFQQFLQSVRFGEGKDAPPQWDLPKGWHQLPGNEQRFATIEVSGSV